MKKVLSIIIACILISITVIPIFHASTGDLRVGTFESEKSKPVKPGIHDSDNLYAERFVSYIQPLLNSGFLHYSVDDFVSEYDELYYHKDENGDTDWVLLYALAGFPDPISVYGTIGNRVFYMGVHSPFVFGLGLYDVKTDSFYDLYTMRDYTAYDGLMEAIDDCGKGRLIGDMDNDNSLSIVDATIIQRCEVKIREYPEYDNVKANGEPIKSTTVDFVDELGASQVISYYSDFNRDDERDIRDVTAMQRYLVGISFPVGE